jgi:hypothetical protein
VCENWLNKLVTPMKATGLVRAMLMCPSQGLLASFRIFRLLESAWNQEKQHLLEQHQQSEQHQAMV